MNQVLFPIAQQATLKTINLGVIGLNEGDGHPYSWSAICNGYDKAAMATCPYPVIPAYLGERRFPEDAIPNTKVTHIWTQDRRISEHVSAASLIPNIVNDPREMIGAVDAILIARDDAECHYELAKPFVEADLPVRLDKVAAPTIAETNAIFDLQTYPGQVQSGSMLRYAPEFQLAPERLATVGKIVQVHGIVIKDWARYGIHIVEPALNVIGTQGKVVECHIWRRDGLENVSIAWESGVQGTFRAVGVAEGPISMTVIGDQNFVNMEFEDTFRCFRAGLAHFIEGVRSRNLQDDRDFTISVLEAVGADSK